MNLLSHLVGAGIGKSVFMAYFFLRYRQEHPGDTIVAAAFNENRILMEAAVSTERSSIETTGQSALARDASPESPR